MRGFFHRFGSATEVLRSAGRARGRTMLRAGAAGRSVVEPLEERRLLTSVIDFDEAVAVASTEVNWGVTSADFNNDGHLDIAAVAAGGSVEVLLNDGAGVFTSSGVFAVGVLPQNAAAADFDGDGNQDLAVVNQFDDTVSILLGNGDGTFAAAVDYVVVADATAISIADATGDGVLDFAVNSGATGFLVILPGVGDGTFGASIPLNYGLNVSDVQLADLDGQNGADLIYTVSSDDSIRVRLNQGGGSFGAEQIFSAGADPQDIAAADMDLDGDLDLAVANAGVLGGDALTVLRNDGSGTLTLLGDTDLPGAAVALQAADLNGDLLPDLAVMLNTGETAALAGDGMGGFVVDATIAPFAGAPNRLTLGDFDGDGDVDAITADAQAHGLSFLANITPAPPTAPDAPDLAATSDLGASDSDDITSVNTDLEFTITGVADGYAVSLYLGATLIGSATAAGDSASIVTDIGVFADGVYEVRAVYNNGEEDSARSAPLTFTIDTTVPAFTSTPETDVAIGPEYTYDANTNEEGDTGLVYALITAPAGMSIDPDTGVVTWTPVLEDFGDNEVIISATDVAGNVGTQEFTLSADTILAIADESTTHALPGASWGMTTGDFNEDGYEDVAVTFVLGSVMIFTSNGDGTLTNGDFYNVGTSPRTAYAADLDGDGHLDLVTVNFGSDNVSVLLGNGDGTFADPVNYD
ncbi:MAG: FG-GAP-like repeat-containing protein, partial [Phycisphaerales bacterium JB038]